MDKLNEKRLKWKKFIVATYTHLFASFIFLIAIIAIAASKINNDITKIIVPVFAALFGVLLVISIVLPIISLLKKYTEANIIYKVYILKSQWHRWWYTKKWYFGYKIIEWDTEIDEKFDRNVEKWIETKYKSY